MRCLRDLKCRFTDALEGTVPKGTYTGIRFTVGVPPTLNHADATLAPGLWWNWQFGYKFARIDLVSTASDRPNPDAKKPSFVPPVHLDRLERQLTLPSGILSAILDHIAEFLRQLSRIASNQWSFELWDSGDDNAQVQTLELEIIFQCPIVDSTAHHSKHCQSP